VSDTTGEPARTPVIGFSLLTILVFLLLAAGCYLASFVLAKNDIATMQQAGFYYWTSSAAWDGSVSNALSYAAPSVWYNYLPGQKLALVLVPAPAYAATRAALAVLLAGLALVPVIFLHGRNRWFIRELCMLLSAIALCAAAFLFMPAPPAGFTIDLKSQLVTVNGAALGAQIQMTPQMIIATTQNPSPLGPLLVPGYSLIIENDRYGNLTIATGARDALNTICNLAMTFINTKGNQV
jgi:hypothetical protein